MTELLSAFSLGQLVLFVVLLAVAIKEVSTFIDWARSKIEKRVILYSTLRFPKSVETEATCPERS